jgi:hypothetical protein
MKTCFKPFSLCPKNDLTGIKTNFLTYISIQYIEL